MISNYMNYRYAKNPMPEQAWAWNMYGPGEENIGRDGRPERLPIPEPAANQMLVRVDSVGLCFSDVKLIRMGGDHPKLYHHDLAQEPTRLGHEAALTVIAVGKDLQDRYHPGQGLAVQPDIYQNGKSTAYGYTIPDGLIQYHLIGPEMLDTDEGACLLPITEGMGYAEASLLEPWGCVLAAYTQRRRMEPKTDGILWIIGRPEDTTDYLFSSGLDKAATIVMTDVPAAVKQLVETTSATKIVRDGIGPDEFADLADEITNASGFDDIVMLDPRSAAAVGAAARQITRRGTLNLVGRIPLDGLVDADVRRLHYDYIAFLGNPGPDIAASYGDARNRCDLHAHGVALFVGAGGPMGQMHVQRAIEQPDGPRLIIATEVSDQRLVTLRERFASLAAKNGCAFLTFNPQTQDRSLHDFVMEATMGNGADDVVVCVPLTDVMAEAATVMSPDGMLVFFAGVPNGTFAPLNLSNVYLHNAQYTGTSGLTLNDQIQVMQLTQKGDLSPGRSVGAIGGMQAAKAGIQAMIEGRYAGKIVIFPQILDLPLMGLNELKDQFPDIADKLATGDMWTIEAEAALFEVYWKG